MPPSEPAPTDEIRHYVRSNRDGSEAENVVHFRPTRTDVAVYKWMSECNGAAYVTAQMDPLTWEPRGLDAGKVGKTGTQEKFGRIDLDLELACQLGEHEARLPVSERVLLPVQEVLFGRDLQRVARDGRA